MSRRPISPLIAALLASIGESAEEAQRTRELKKNAQGAIEGCDCPVCQIIRGRAGPQEPDRVEAPETPNDKLIKTVAAVATDDHVVSVGFSVPETSDETPMVAIRLDDNSEGILLTAGEAEIVAYALIEAVNRVQD